MFSIIDLRTEYQENPLGLESQHPRFSYQYFTKMMSFKQKSCRILVASRIDLLSHEIADKWDSGWLHGRQMIGIEYQGKALSSRELCYWKCLCEDESGEIVESDVAFFEMGLLDKDDWKGRWVSIPSNFNGGALFFRKQFDLSEGKIRRARAFICGIGYHEFHVNGKKIGDTVLEPATSNYGKRIYYNTYDITHDLHQGANVIGVVLGYGWFGARKLLGNIFIEFEDGRVFEEYTGHVTGWWATGSPITGNGIYEGEIYDARLEDQYPRWCTAEFQPFWSNGWMYAMLTPPPEGLLVSQTIEPMRVTKTFTPKKIHVLDENKLVYDMGQVFAGWVRIRVKGERGAKITLRYAEGLTEAGSVNQLNLRSAKSRDIYILKGSGVEEYAPRFTYHGFGWVQAEIEGNAKILSLTGELVRTSVKECGYFECSDKDINQLHQNAVMTEASNMPGILTDCPQRDERFGWLNDLASRIYQTVCNFSMERFFPKFVRDISDTQEDGMISDTAPYYVGSIPADPVCVCYLLMALDCYRLYGNKRLIEEEYDHFKAWVDYLTTRTQDYILNYSYYGDWCPPGNFHPNEAPYNQDCPGELISTAYYYWHVRCLLKMAELTNNQVDANYYRILAEKIYDAYNNAYYDAVSGGYGTSSQACNAISLNLGLVPEERRSHVAKLIANDIIKRDYHHATGNQAYRHLFYSLSGEGYGDVLHKMLVNPTYPGWGYMLAQGATTIWERWEAEMQNCMHSFCHPMFGSFDGWLYNLVAGINICNDAFGADRIIVKPYLLNGLSYAKAHIDTLRGRIACSWQKEGDGVTYEIEVPANTDAEISLQHNIIEINDKPPTESGFELKWVKDRHTLKVGSGKYMIITKM